MEIALIAFPIKSPKEIAYSLGRLGFLRSRPLGGSWPLLRARLCLCLCRFGAVFVAIVCSFRCCLRGCLPLGSSLCCCFRSWIRLGLRRLQTPGVAKQEKERKICSPAPTQGVIATHILLDALGVDLAQLCLLVILKASVCRQRRLFLLTFHQVSLGTVDDKASSSNFSNSSYASLKPVRSVASCFNILHEQSKSSEKPESLRCPFGVEPLKTLLTASDHPCMHHIR